MSTVLVEVYTSELSTAKTEHAFLLEGEKIDGTSETVGIQWVSTDYQEYDPLARVLEESSEEEARSMEKHPLQHRSQRRYQMGGLHSTRCIVKTYGGVNQTN